jgi:catechol 2,3-dioxygenase-like lactoylglutathione lyase family enzyme
MSFVVFSGSALLLACALALSSQAPAAPPPFSLEEIRIGATDVGASRDLYARLLGFRVVGESGDDVTLVNNGTRVVLHPAAAPAHVHYPDAAYAYVNVEVDDLAASRQALVDGGVRFLHEAPRKAAIGEFLAFEDPAGNIQQIFEREPEAEVAAPTVFNVGIKVIAMDQARRFYCDTLGFEVFSEDFYPPVLPLKQRGMVSLALHESAREKAAIDYPGEAATVLVFSTPDVDAAVAYLRARGVEVLARGPRASAAGPFVAFRDPFGNVYELRKGQAGG